MATLREIKGRIGSIKNIEKITRAMKMVASVKFRKAQQNVVAARPYAKKIGEILMHLIPTVEDMDNELVKPREVKKILVVVVSGDRGLSGSFNANLIKAAQQSLKEKYAEYLNNGDLSLITIGRKAFDYFNKREYDIYAKYTGIFDKLNFSVAKEVVRDIVTGYKERKFDKVVVIYNEFKSVVQSKISEEQFLPIPAFTPAEGESKKQLNYIFEPSAKAIVDSMLPRHLNTQIWRVLLESYASEQAAQMTAMDSATNNANELVTTLQLFYNRARQAAITKEILEVVGGAEALREA